MPENDQLLMVRTESANPLVEQHLAACILDDLTEMAVLVLAEAKDVEMGAPHQTLDDDASFGGVAEQLGDRRPLSRNRSSGSPRQSVKNT